MADQEFDVVVVGSGGAGMTAALAAAKKGLSVVLVEKAPHYGGSTARSGGGVWIPNNSVLQRDGVLDTPEAARTYLRSIVGDVVPAERIDTYVDRGPEVLDFVLANSPLRLEWVKDYSDYYPEAPGGRLGGRSVEPKPFDLRQLGSEADKLEPGYAKAPANMVVMQSDYRWLNLLQRPTTKGIRRSIKVSLRMFLAKARGQNSVGMGRALIAGLRKGLLDAGVPVWLETPMTGLVTEGSGNEERVVGITAMRNGEEVTLRARLGVVMGSGGFEHNQEMRDKYQRQPIPTDWTVGAAANTGEGIEAMEQVGAELSFMEDAWWGPTIMLPRGPWFALAERSLPCSFMVNPRGERFMNESLPYVEAGHRMYGGEYGQGEGPAENLPAWIIFDQEYKNRYLFAGLQAKQPLPRKWLATENFHKADTLAELAELIGVPADALERTAERFNGFAEKGRDEDFQRGQSGYDHYYGDPTNKPNPSLGPVRKAPFYAATMVPGDLGTKGGANTDVHGRVLREDGSVIEGLYAAGNASSPVMGHTYAGPGATIGPAMVFGYLAVEHMLASTPSTQKTGV
ncbi:3-ketosteroid-delta-1-dehydrogenase [Dietzia sp. HMSC21D01]|uniref:3-oxosteroid 1-dehydrogenase n=1 Tax=Dietzia cinnamea TaxID=321318 RepID=A0AAW5Q4L2_9ACTN|nr:MULTISPECIES: 3-oxosteroid 1-dehydrogenase [Dietzia]MBM7229263.1 3-oxosteroid 1-dehydrogenase [Dietzia cinnamea]MCT1638887.1 3-oxosteroid 1-dehydrogenase [Dietzia cinnamea]MCT1710788.1 3-oxosteroid 1-dehydrogenase [Dietzia cinnamea]MCT1863452.1 3-oxosteroid 1-dehydrogenase [Dietzia cinnamea]MCT2030448.1 3-oxosteroid 1-dehydrogenase [Dietzia cinnamea]